MKQNPGHVVILGAGVIGLCCALYAARSGLRVTVLERGPRRRDGCSFGNAGLVVPSHFTPLAAPGMIRLGLKWMRDPESPFHIAPRLDPALLGWGLRFWRAAGRRRAAAAEPVVRDLALLSRHCFENLALRQDPGLVRNGLLMLCKHERTLEEEAATAARAHDLGLEASVLDARAAAAVDPGVTMDVAGAVLYPGDCHLSPSALMAALEVELAALGVDIMWDTEVNGFAREQGRLRAALTPAGEVAGDEFVLCGGVWSDGLARSLGLRLPMQAGKGYSLTLPEPRQLPGLPSLCVEARLAVTPMNGALRFGGTMEIAGLDESINPRRVRGIVRAVPDYFPAFEPTDFEGVEPWRGLRPVSPDGMPYIGRTGRWDNLTVATGHAMMGLSLAPATGLIVSRLLAGEHPGVPLDLCAVDRFAGGAARRGG